MLRDILIICFLFIPFQTNSYDAHYPRCDQTNLYINALYKHLPKIPTTSISARIAYISKQFLGKPYALSALGEGSQGYFDQAPLYRTDAFDCETYVDTVLALAFANNLPTFKQCIQNIRYRKGHIAFIDRNHFTCLDWNQNNQKQGLLRDITTTIHDKNNKSIAVIAQAWINKSSWYNHFSSNRIRIRHPSSVETSKRLRLLQQKGQALPTTHSSIPYIPLTALFDHAGHANHEVLKQIPNGAIIEIIRPNWDLSKEIGTHLNVSHLGFAIWENKKLMFLQASSTEQKVVQIPLIEYLRKTLTSPTIKGINIQIAMKSIAKSK
ncbi:MAG: DUF1460 domain-containing protein [Legionellaceae bacterium]|nr:DUF1460 domain-containing protein [Legionellaceae bacterium]